MHGKTQAGESTTGMTRSQPSLPERRLEEFDFARPREAARLERSGRLEKPLLVLSVLAALGVIAGEVWIVRTFFDAGLSMETATLLMWVAAFLAVLLCFLGIHIIRYFNAVAERRLRLQEEHRALLRGNQERKCRKLP
jgi:hypothetical protein